MSSKRDAFLRRVREAVAVGNQAGKAPPLPERGTVGYQGGGANPIERFKEQLEAAGGRLYLVPDAAAAVSEVLHLVETLGASKVLLGQGIFIDTLNLAMKLRASGRQVVQGSDYPPDRSREPFFQANLGITGVHTLIAETGTIALLCRPDEPRSFSLLPPVHIAVAERRQLLPDLFDLFEHGKVKEDLPSCLTLITGPSKTGDIELRLVTGVHGPGEVHVVLVERP